MVLAALALVVAGCGGGSSSAGDGFQFEREPESADEAAHWAEVWCEVNGSMTREDAIELMGKPSVEFDATEGAPQSQWDAGPFDYTLFYDEDGYVKQAQVNELQLAPEDKPFPCAYTRFF